MIIAAGCIDNFYVEIQMYAESFIHFMRNSRQSLDIFFSTPAVSSNFHRICEYYDRKCSQRSELHGNEGIIVIGALHWILSATASEKKQNFLSL